MQAGQGGRAGEWGWRGRGGGVVCGGLWGGVGGQGLGFGVWGLGVLVLGGGGSGWRWWAGRDLPRLPAVQQSVSCGARPGGHLSSSSTP